MSQSKLDANQCIKSAYDDNNEALSFVNASSLVPEKYDEMDLTYVGDDLTQVVYKLASSTVATLTLSYSGGKLSNVIKS